MTPFIDRIASLRLVLSLVAIATLSSACAAGDGPLYPDAPKPSKPGTVPLFIMVSNISTTYVEVDVNGQRLMETWREYSFVEATPGIYRIETRFPVWQGDFGGALACEFQIEADDEPRYVVITVSGIRKTCNEYGLNDELFTELRTRHYATPMTPNIGPR